MTEKIKRIMAGHGGDSILICGREKTAVIDTGMAYCGDRLAELLAAELSGRPLDYILLTHSHYDHVGGAPYLKRAWPRAEVCASTHAAYVFGREGARRRMRELANMAGTLYLGEQCPPVDYRDEELACDRILEDEERLELGSRTIRALHMPGHTNCSMSYFLEEESTLFHCESIGCYPGGKEMSASVLTSFPAALASVRRCREMSPAVVYSPHYGRVTDVPLQAYFDLAEEEINRVRAFVQELAAAGRTPEEMLTRCTEEFWTSRPGVNGEQPLAAFTVNMKASIQAALAEDCRG